MALHVAAHHFLRRCLAKIIGGRGRHGARIGSEEVAAGGQHVGTAARRRAGRPRLDVVAIKRGEQGSPFGLCALPAQWIGFAFRRAAVNMQPVLDGEILEVAKPGVYAAQRLVRCIGAGNARFGRQAGLLRGLDDQLGQTVAATAVESVSLRVFVDQPLKPLLRLVEAGAGEWRWQVAERHGRNAALGLCRLAGIGDDEGIDDRQGASDDLGKTGVGERHRLARQPLQRAVRADMDDGVHAERFLQPEPEGDERVARGERWVVVVGPAIGRASAIGGQCHGDVAEVRCAEGEGCRVGCLAQPCLVLCLAPCGPYGICRRGWQARRQASIVVQAQPLSAHFHRIKQLTRRLRNSLNHIALFLQVMQHDKYTRRHVEADGIAGAAGRARIVWDQDRQLAQGPLRLLQADDVRGAGDESLPGCPRRC